MGWAVAVVQMELKWEREGPIGALVQDRPPSAWSRSGGLGRKQTNAREQGRGQGPLTFSDLSILVFIHVLSHRGHFFSGPIESNFINSCFLAKKLTNILLMFLLSRFAETIAKRWNSPESEQKFWCTYSYKVLFSFCSFDIRSKKRKMWGPTIWRRHIQDNF